MKRIPVQTTIGLLMILAVLVLSGAGYLSYRNISAIVASMKVDLTPGMRLLNIRDLSMDLQNAENSIRIFSITGNRNDLKPYYNTIRSIDARIASVRTECMNDPDLLEQTDTIAALIDVNIKLWNELLLLHNNENIVEELKQISDQIEKAAVIEPKIEIVPEKLVEKETPAKEEPKKKGFFQRLFSRKKEPPPDTTVVEIPVAMPVLPPEETPVESPEPQKATISTEKKEEIKRNIGKIQEDDKEVREKLAQHETRIALTGNRLREKIYDLISRMESEVKLMNEAKSEDADKLARQTYYWLMAFMITGIILALSVIITIISFVRKANSYNSAIIRSRDEAEKLAKAKELFMANMSHEIRTPVTAIAGFTEQLLHERHDEKTDKTLSVIKSAADHLSKIINDVLDFSKLHNSNLLFEDVNFSLRGIFDEVFSLFVSDASRNGSTLTYSVSPHVPLALLGDPYRLRQVLINLVSNAIKFTKNGKIHFSADSDQEQVTKTLIIITVTDTGIGIEQDKLNLIFEDFSQAEMSTTRNYGGTGLGLSIVRKIVEMQGGNIDVKSRRGQGTQIACRIPFSVGDESLLKSTTFRPSIIPEKIKTLTVLIADDEEYNRLLFRMILERWGIRFEEASNGMEAVEKLRSGHFDLVFMDARMPELDGLEATKIIRQELRLNIPIICISAANPDNDGFKFRQAGMDDFLMKPFTEEQLLRSMIAVTGTMSDESDVNRDARNISVETKQKANLENLYHLTGNDWAFARQMLVSFIETTTKGITELENAVIEGNHKGAYETAHRLIPPCRHIGATEMTGLLKEIESLTTENTNTDDLSGTIGRLTDEFGSVREILMAEITDIDNKIKSGS